MIIPDKKKAVSVIMSRIGKDGHYKSDGSAEIESEISPHLEAKSSHAESMIDAISSKEPKALVAALDAFLNEHELHRDEDSEKPDED